MDKQEPHASKLLNIRQVQSRIPIARSTLWRLCKSGQFPRPLKIGQARSLWLEAEIDEFIRARTAERDGGER